MIEHNLHAVAYPVLDDAQIDQITQSTGASLRQYEAGQTLFLAGERDFRFFVIKSGEVEIVDPSGDTPNTVVVHRTGEFTGDATHLTDSPSLVTAVARTDCDVVEVRLPSWSRRREPFLLETSRPGVFAAGDVRAGSIKRVASAVGEGAMTVAFVHEFLRAM